MQPFPEQPANRPSYAPAEIYVPEQPQAFAPPTPVSMPPEQQPGAGQEIAIYYNHKYIKTYARICTVLLFVLIVLFLVLATITLVSAISPDLALAWGTSIQSGDIPAIIFSFVVILVAIAVLVWWNKLIRLSSGPARKPVLHITREGLTIQNAILVKHRFIRWEEMKTIYAHSTLLKIRSAAPLSPQADGQALPQRTRTTIISLPYLDTPGQEILRQLVQMYSNELSRYNIQFRP